MLKKSLSLKKNNIVGGLFAIIATMIVMAPYHADNALWGNNIHSIWIGIIYALSVLVVLLSIYLLDFKKINLGIILAACSVIIYVLLNVFHSYNSEYNGFFLVIQCVAFCFLPADVKKIAFETFKKIWIVICCVGLVCFLLYALKIPVSYQEMPYYFSGHSLKYINFGVSFLYQDSTMFRLCGLCNEPGYFGTICALLLCADNISLKKKSNIILFIGGFLTFSVAFFMILIAYLFLRAIATIINNRDARKRVLYSICLILAVVLYFNVLPNIVTGNVAIDKTIQRLVLTEEGIAGDNRTTEEFEGVFKSVMKTNPWFGMGKGYVGKETEGGNLSYKVYLVEYGLVGCLLIWGTLLFAASYKNINNGLVVLFIFVFFASIYQRPHIILLPFFLILLGGIEYIKVRTELDKKKQIQNERVEIDG